MENKQLDEIFSYFDRKQKDCLIQKLSYNNWLKKITPYRWLAIVMGVILPAILGVTIFTDSGLISPTNWKYICSSVLLLSSIVSGLHTALKCDSHQQECLRLSKQYESLANKFELAKTLRQEEIENEKKILGEQYSDLIANTLTTPSQNSINKAKMEYENKNYR